MITQQKVPVVYYEPLKTVSASKVSVMDPFTWLKEGWKTFTLLKVQAITFGLVFAIIGASISYAAINNAQMLFAFWSGFLLTAPLLAMATFHMAQSHDQGKNVSFSSCAKLLRSQPGNTLLLVLFLVIVMIAWIRISTLSVAIYSAGATVNIELGMSLFNMANVGLFATLGVVTSVFSVLMFALLAWSMPMLARGHQHSFATAIASSVKTVLSQPVTMLLWGALVAGLTLLSMATFFAAFVVVFPWLGFATWEGYKRLFES